MAAMVQAVADQRGISLPEAARVIFGQVLVCGAQPQDSNANALPFFPALPPPRLDAEILLFPELHAVDTAKEAARKKRDAEREAELAWRIAEVWEDFLFAREAFFRDVSGVKPGSLPEIRLVRNDIRQALLIHDRDRLALGDRDRWRRESPVRAAGIGIFYDPWCAGTSPQNDARNGGKRYLEPWRPWKPQKGKPDPVTRFAELYFEVRDQEEARRP